MEKLDIPAAGEAGFGMGGQIQSQESLLSIEKLRGWLGNLTKPKVRIKILK